MKFNKKVLKNGLRLITVPMKDNPTATVLVLVEAGSKYEDKKINGLSHFLEHMCFKGTTKRPKAIDISRELDSIGAHYNAFTSQEFTGYYAKSDKKHLSKIMDVVSDMYLDPIFDEKEIEKEKGVIVEEINMYEDLPQRNVHDILAKILYGDTPAGRSIAGTKETVRSFKRGDFINYRKKNYVAEATTVVIAGGIDEKKAIAEAERLFSQISSGKKQGKEKVVEKQEKPAISIKKKETDQMHLVLGVRTFDTYNKKNPSIQALNEVLSGGMSSRLFQKLRDEMGICYYVRSSNDESTDHGFFQVSAGVDKNRLKEAISAILEEFRKLRDIPVGEDELRKIKDCFAGSTALSLESSDAFAEFYGAQEILRKKIKNSEEIVKEIEKITAKDIQKIAKEIFVNKNLNLAIVGDVKDEKEVENVFRI